MPIKVLALVPVLKIVQGQKFVNFMPKEIVILVLNVKIDILMLLEKRKDRLIIGQVNVVANVHDHGANHLLIHLQEEDQDLINEKSSFLQK